MPRAYEYLTSENIKTKTSEWLTSIRKSVKPRNHLIPSIKQSVLIVIDMEKYFVHPNAPSYLPASTAILKNIVDLIDFYLSYKRPVVFTRHCHLKSEGSGMLGKFFGSFIDCDSPFSTLIEDFSEFKDHCITIRKNTYDAFWNTNLDETLKSSNTSQVLLCGVMTHLCCETTSRSAFVRGYEVYSIIDAMASSSERSHVSSLTNLAEGVSVIYSTDEILSILKNTKKDLKNGKV